MTTDFETIRASQEYEEARQELQAILDPLPKVGETHRLTRKGNWGREETIGVWLEEKEYVFDRPVLTVQISKFEGGPIKAINLHIIDGKVVRR